jgi:pSer/pThr/pTyr-binding forkhead associated (FHA) protein
MDGQQHINTHHTSSHPRVALIELNEPVGSERRTVDVLAWPLTLGRALDNHIVIDDPFVAAHHALLDLDANGSLQLTVLDSVNGAQINASSSAADQLASGQSRALPVTGALFQLGNTSLRLRLPHEALRPEQVLPKQSVATGVALRTPASASRRAWPWLAGLALMAFQTAGFWISLDPGADFSAWFGLLVAVPVALVLWCGVWALLSKLFNHHFDFLGHLKLALPWSLAMAMTQVLWPQISASLAAPLLWRLTPLMMVVLAAFLVRTHLSHVLPNKRKAVGVGVAAMALGAVGVAAAGNYRSHDSLSSAPYMSTLPLPALRLGSTSGEQKLVQGLTPLAAQLAERVKKARDDEEEGDDAAE